MTKIIYKKLGFSLLELIVVMAILLLISGGIYSNFQISQKKARDAERKSELRQMQNALEVYYNDWGYYPVDDSAGNMTDENCGGTSCSWGSTAFEKDSKVYIQQLPQDPSGGMYYYRQTQTGKGYQLYAGLENSNDSCFESLNCKIAGFTGTNCSAGGSTFLCNYGVSSSNEKP